MSKLKSESGFTLIEMMITVVVICVLVVIGFPSFKAILRDNRIATQTNSFLASINLAREEAIKNNYNAVICATDPTVLPVACGTNWNTGWMVFDDPNNNGTLDAGETIVRVVKGNPGTITFQTNPAGGAGTISFNHSGMFTSTAGLPIQFSLQAVASDCPTGYQGVRNFTLLTIGQLTVQKANCP